MLNILRRRFASRVFVQGLPVDWDRSEVTSRFGIVGQLDKVHLVLDNLGKPTGKAVLSYVEDDAGDQAIKHFDNRAVENLVCRVKPYFEKGQEKPRTDENLLSRRLYLQNVPYDATVKEITDLVKEFAEIDQVVVPRDK